MSVSSTSSTSSTSSSGVNLNGMQTLSQMTGSMNYATIIQELYDAEKAPGDDLDTNIQQDQLYINDWSNISNLATTLQNDLVTLATPSTYSSFTTTATGSVSSATAQSGATPGTYNITLTKAGSDATTTSSSAGGASGVNGAIGSPVSNSTLLSANTFSQAITNGSISFTYNGQNYSYTVNTSNSLGTTLNDLTNLTSGAVNFSYNATTNTISVDNTGSGKLVLGSAGDSSNFFQAVGLNGNTANVGDTTTSQLVGVAQLQQTLSNANLAGGLDSTPTDGTSSIIINGTTINYNTSTDTLESLMQSINSSTAGVTASYDPISDKMTLTSKTAQPITVQDGTDSNGNMGNLASVLGISGTSSAGSNWVYSVGSNSGLSSPSATVDNAIPGVSFTFASTTSSSNSGTLTVSQNSSTLTTAINQFVTDFNNMYSEIQNYTGKGGDLESDTDLTNLGMQMMENVLSVVPSAQSAGYGQTTAMGIGLTTGAVGSAPGTTNSLQLNASTLVQQFEANPGEVQTILQGIASTLNNTLTNYTGNVNSLTPTSTIASLGQGVIAAQQAMYNNDITNLENQQTQIYSTASTYEQNLTAQFNALQEYEEQMTMEQEELSALGDS